MELVICFIFMVILLFACNYIEDYVNRNHSKLGPDDFKSPVDYVFYINNITAHTWYKSTYISNIDHTEYNRIWEAYESIKDPGKITVEFYEDDIDMVKYSIDEFNEFLKMFSKTKKYYI